NIAELLQAFKNEETAKLDVYELNHGPTIGDMYEGLSKDILSQAIPPQLNLKIVEGFVTDGKQFLSGQIDCMLVRGEGERIPYTNSYKWHVKDVLVVFEVKKNLYSKDLIDSFYKLRQISTSYFKYLLDGNQEKNKTVDLSPSYKTFSQITGITAPPYHHRETLSPENELIYTSIFMEQLMPVKIVLGYDGFSSEFSLREGLIKFIEDEGKGEGYGVPSFPQLIICGKYSLVKHNGRPYSSALRDGYWDFMTSSKTNPILLMLELIWTKLSLEFDIDMPWGDDLEIENFNEFLRAKPVIKSDTGGWILNYPVLSKDNLESRKESKEWEPTEVTSSVYAIFNHLVKHNISITDPDFVEFAIHDFGSIDECIKQIISTNIVSFNGKSLSLLSDKLIVSILSDGRFVIAENSSGLFDLWLEKNDIKKTN
ncbi:hypothetical protein QF204_04895, partial [Proteus faecis]|uniref:DUF6602 domain-containing protein n=1 Tax=Proteus faecis TaxID=2050967 RepID=UPI00257FB065